ncbi:hypothetical protein P7K49_008177 [Saguinus oedipus]|uniref:Uncharacterized protein n=1 Tax=Saguinus oedipus TaxID=9490 RepID=A0ABQ9VWZ7_SAGOE|nr:hypothetical protein P7K49_008177 [Saguinus oedipus]
MASIVSSICSGGDVEPLQALQCDCTPSIVSSIGRASKPSSVILSQALQCDPVASIVSSICSGGHLQPLAELASQRDLMSAASTKCSTSSKTQPALPHKLMATSSTQITTQSTLGQPSLLETSVLEARQPEAVLAQPTRSSIGKVAGFQ